MLQHMNPKDMTLSGEASLRRTSTDSIPMRHSEQSQTERTEGLRGLSDSQEPTSGLQNGQVLQTGGGVTTLVPLSCT